MAGKRYQTFNEFYPFYLSEHSKSITKILHVIGSLSGLSLLLFFILFSNFQYIPLAFIPGYGFAWIGHYIFEKNQPATFKYPIYSFIGDWIMLKDIFTGKIKI